MRREIWAEPWGCEYLKEDTKASKGGREGVTGAVGRNGEPPAHHCGLGHLPRTHPWGLWAHSQSWPWTVSPSPRGAALPGDAVCPDLPQ